MSLLRQVLLSLVACLFLVPATLFAQTGGIAGVVRDTSGAVLPGVNVEAASDALIEKTRTVVTDEQGRYNIVDLRPGLYSVTFSLQGFSTYKREGLELSAATVIPLNADLKVGSLEETLTVTGATPVVDVQSVRQRQVLGREVLETIPRSRDGAMTAGLLTGVTAVGVQDSGGSGAGVISQLTAHGSDAGDQQWNIDGMKASTGGRRVLITNDQSAQELTYEVSGMSAESAVGGVRMNAVPKEGGNAFRGTLMGATPRTDDQQQSHRRTEGQRCAVGAAYRSDLGFLPSFGGPILKDKIWFYFTYRNWGSDGNYANIFYDSDPTREAENPNRLWDANLRLTTQISKRNKLNLYYDRQGRSQPFRFVSNLQSPSRRRTGLPGDVCRAGTLDVADHEQAAVRGGHVVLQGGIRSSSDSGVAGTGNASAVRSDDRPLHALPSGRRRHARTELRQHLRLQAVHDESPACNRLAYHQDRVHELLGRRAVDSAGLAAVAALQQ
jgi:hypothetical protein